MIFNKHYDLEGRHAFLSASQHHWTNYSDEKIVERFQTVLAAAKGTELHEFAANAIRLGIKLKGTTQTIVSYVNDAIGYRMTPELVLKYSDNAFGTADAISFRKNELRIHDLKTGVTPTSFKQLMVYAAFFCLEYRIKPATIRIIMRIYQNDEVREEIADPKDIIDIMDTIVRFDKLIELKKAEALS